MDSIHCAVLLNIVFLIVHITVCHPEGAQEGGSRKSELTNSYGENGTVQDEENRILDMYRVIPAALTIMIFVVGSISISCYERGKDRKRRRKELDDIDEEEDNELNAAWISTVTKRSRGKGNVMDKFRRMSLAMRSHENERDLEKERKYKIYDDMLEKYRETLRVLRKGAKPPLSGDRPSTRIKNLAEMHKQKTTDTQMSEDSPPSQMDQYTLTLELLKSEAEQEYHSNEEQINEPIPEEADVKHTQDQKVKENDDTEEPEEIDPVYLTKRRRSSRFRKQAVIEEDGSFDRPSLSKAGALFQSYMASQEDIEMPLVEKAVSTGKLDDDDQELLEVLQKSSKREISALHRIQQRMRPKSFIETLAAIHRETASLSSPHATSMSALPFSSPSKSGSKGSLSKLALKTTVVNQAKHENKPAVESMENIPVHAKVSASPVLREKRIPRNRPKSLYETDVARRKISQTRRARVRPASLYIQHRIQDAIPETQVSIDIEPEVPSKSSKSSSRKYLEIGSLHDLPFHSMTVDEEENVIAEIEKQLIAQVCDENDLSSDEIKALETLLDDVVTYSKKDPQDIKPKVEKQFSFTDSVSLFGDMEPNELEEADESEETVLMSLKDVNMPSSSKRLSYSAYDNV